MEAVNNEWTFEMAENMLFNEYCDVKALQDRRTSIQMMQFYMSELNIDISQLKFVHVTGSKGKGTTCAYVEAALRKHGMKTGLYTSPHLQSLCERFRVNGQEITRELYLQHFSAVWNKLQEIKARTDRPDYIANWPGFFRFLTLIAFRVFIAERVDIVVVEVGMGGRLDCTNVIERPITTGITLIDLEHTEILGHTLNAIATEKGGIFKQNALAVVLDQQTESLEALYRCARIAKCGIQVVSRTDLPYEVTEGVSVSASYLLDNFSVAFYIIENTLHFLHIPLSLCKMREVLCETSVAARCQHISYSLSPQIDLEVYLDGAHTPRSMVAAYDWFEKALVNVSAEEEKVLLFYSGRDKDISSLISTLVSLPFDRIIFTMVKNPKPEYTKITISSVEEIVARMMLEKEVRNGLFSGVEVIEPEWLHYLAHIWRVEEYRKKQQPKKLSCVIDVEHFLSTLSSNHYHRVTVCCTGSLYLCGDMLNALQ